MSLITSYFGINLPTLTILIFLILSFMLSETIKNRKSYICLIEPIDQIDDLDLQKRLINHCLSYSVLVE